jgi:integration host factor subunit alpha
LTNSKYTKNNFINELSKKTGFSKSISKKIINDLLEIIIMNISTGKFVLKNIGTFKLLKKKERVGRNPKTKEEFIIKSRKSLTFIVSKHLSSLLNLYK